LGAVNMSPMQVMNIYSNFATGGFKYPTKSIRSVVDQNGQELQRYSLTVQPTIDATTAFTLNYGLQQVMSTGTGRSAYSALPRNLNLAGKSGTTNDTRDSWFAGYSGNYLTVVWLGLDDNKVTGLTGSSGALPVWTNVMSQLKQKPVNLAQPESVEWLWLDHQSGFLSAEGCSGAMYVPVRRNAVPKQSTGCAASQYEEEQINADSLPSSTTNDNSYDQYIFESSPENSVDGEGRVISSGSFNQ
jgi:penicillin-binding protein 1B